MLLCRFFVIILLCVSSVAYSQFTDDFTDGELLSNPTWIGDLDDFVVENGRLQLNAAEAGQSNLFTSIDVVDDYEWSVSFTLDFAPSASNQLIIYLWSETENVEENSLALMIGENGSDDALTLVELSSNTILAEGIATRVASDPVELELLINYNDAFLSVQSKTPDEVLFTDEFEVFIGEGILGDGFFGLECRYTASRADEFFFDQIAAGIRIPDEQAPIILETSFIPDNQFCLTLDEPIDLDNSNVELDATPIQLTNIALNINQIKFTVAGDVPQEFQLDVSGVFDLSGNELDTTISISPVFTPESGDILINEILFNPRTDGVDFVELISTSSRTLDLQNLTILNTSNDRQVTITNSLVIPPQGIIALTSDPEETIAAYPNAAVPERIFNLSLPSFNNGDGNVTIQLGDQLLDEFDYDEDFHNALLDDVDAVSLERISLTAPTNDPSNWSSASQVVGFGTPGNTNSTLSNFNGEISIEMNSSFSPNGDNQDDELEIQIQARPGFLATVNIYNDSGSHILTLNNNTLLGGDNTLVWDGNLENGDRAPIGIYIIQVSLFNPDGATEVRKQAVALRDFIN